MATKFIHNVTRTIISSSCYMLPNFH